MLAKPSITLAGIYLLLKGSVLKAHTGMTQYMKSKPTKWGFKLFVLADSSKGYTVDFAVHTDKNNFPTAQGLSYDCYVTGESFLPGFWLSCVHRPFLHKSKALHGLVWTRDWCSWCVQNGTHTKSNALDKKAGKDHTLLNWFDCCLWYLIVSNKQYALDLYVTAIVSLYTCIYVFLAFEHV